MTTTSGRSRQQVNIKRRFIVAGIILLLMALSTAFVFISVLQSDSDELAGNVLIWHTFADDDADALNRVITAYEKLNPGINVHQLSTSTREELLEQYLVAVNSGLGPDLILGDSEWITSLAESGSIDAIGDQVSDEVKARFLPVAIASLMHGEELYGLPLSLSVPALYYNTKLVDKPPDSLDGLLTQAAGGHTVLLSTDFRDAYWGVQAFGGEFLDEEGRAILDQGGYANWLDWLMTAHIAPGMILDNNRDSLQERFLHGDASYYVGYPEELRTLLEGLGESTVGVAPLPSGPIGSAGPLLSVNALMFSPASSENQRKISLDLAQYLTKAEQSATLMHRAEQIPANAKVRINPRLYPQAAAFLAQAPSAISLPNTNSMNEAWSVAERAYSQVLSGIITPVEAAMSTTTAVNDLNGIKQAEKVDTVCTNLGAIRLVHDWDGADAEVIEEIVRRFKKVCPLVIVDVDHENLDVTRAKWQRNPIAATNPDIVLASQGWLADALADSIHLKDIGPSVTNETLQRYLPTALSGMRAENLLLGLPISARVHVLYYNKSMVDDPASVLERLRLQADNGLPIMLDAHYIPSYWGIGAFGGRMIDDGLDPTLHEEAFASWLEWLRDSRDNHGIGLGMEPGEVKRAVLDGSSAYYVGDPNELVALTEGGGVEDLGIALLPAGPESSATPLFVASGFFFNDALSEEDLATALQFALFATNAENQQLLIDSTHRMPTNATVDVSDRPHVATYLEQARTAYPIPNCPDIGKVLQLGDQAYIDVLENGVDPKQAALEVTVSIYEACGLDPSMISGVKPTATNAPTEVAATATPDVKATTPDATGIESTPEPASAFETVSPAAENK